MVISRLIPTVSLVCTSALSTVFCVEGKHERKFTPIEEAVAPGLSEGEERQWVDIRELKSLGNPLNLAIVWHQHQPMPIKEPLTEEYDTAWGRVYGMKNYYDMAAVLQNYPKIHCTINLTPTLLVQLKELIEQWERGEPIDKPLRLTLKPSSKLTEEDKRYLVLRFLPAHRKNMIAPHPRYEQLRMKRVLNPDGSINISQTLKKYTNQDYLDLQVWFNLSWFDPGVQEGDVELPSGERVTIRSLISKGRGFTEEDKLELVDIQFKILKSIVPIHRKLQDKGQIELATTPFSNAILPLIYDTDLAKVSGPKTPLPKRLSYPEDVKTQVELAVDLYEESFGKPPRGILPAEGSVSAQLIPLLSDLGIKWWASGEGVLARSLGEDSLTPDELYHPYRVAENGKELTIIFQDTQLSNALVSRCVTPQRVEGANHFLQRLYEIHTQSADWEDPPLVALILEGDRLFKHYESDGKDFFHSLYSQISQADWVKTVTIEEYLAQFPPKRGLENLCPGSWLNSDFSAWIGEKEENLAWEYLLEARETVEQAKGKVSDEKIGLAMEQIYTAEGSEWFRWYGDDHPHPQGDGLFDMVFRRTLKNVYYLLGFNPPGYLEESIVQRADETTTEPEKLSFSVDDPEGDDYGPGTYTYPTDESFSPGVLDLLRFEVFTTEEDVIFRLRFKDLINPWRAPLGFSHPMINIYLSTCSTDPSSTGTHRQGANVSFDPENPWHFLVKAAGWPGYGRMIYSAKGKLLGQCEVGCDLEKKAISISVPKALVGDPEGSSWAYYVLIGAQDGFGPDNYRPVEEAASRWSGGGNTKGSKAPRVYDVLDPVPNGKTQKEMLGSYDSEKGEPAIVYPVILR